MLRNTLGGGGGTDRSNVQLPTGSLAGERCLWKVLSGWRLFDWWRINLQFWRIELLGDEPCGRGAGGGQFKGGNSIV